MARRLLLVACVLLLLSWKAWAEEILFADRTEEQLFAPLAAFLEKELHLSLSPVPLHPPRGDELAAALAGKKAYLFLGYGQGNLLFFEAWDLEKPRKILGMVRRSKDASLFLEELKRRLVRLLERMKEWKLLFVRYEEGQSRIVLTNLRGGKEVFFTPPQGGDVEAISITPEGRFLLATVSAGSGTNIFRFDLLSHTWNRLSPPEFSDSSPAFFPSRRTILFLSERGGKRGIYEMNLDGSKQRLLLERENPVQWVTASLYAPVFAFSEFRDGRWRLTLWDILRGEEQTFDFPGNVLYPTFGGQEKLFFIGEEKGRYDVYSVALTDGSATQITFDGLPKAYLAVSPGGERLAFSTETDRGNWDIVVLEVDGRRAERVTASWARETSPIFSPIPMY